MDPIETKSAAMIIQDLQNDVIIEGGAFADSGAPAHATAQNVVENVKHLAAACREAGQIVVRKRGGACGRKYRATSRRRRAHAARRHGARDDGDACAA